MSDEDSETEQQTLSMQALWNACKPEIRGIVIGSGIIALGTATFLIGAASDNPTAHRTALANVKSGATVAKRCFKRLRQTLLPHKPAAPAATTALKPTLGG